MKSFNQIIEELRKEFEQDPKILAFLVTGSVARGEAIDGNDVDILLVTKGEKISREYREGESLIEIGTVVLPFALEKIEANPMQAYMYLDAKAVFDRDDCLQTLQKKAQEVLDNYKPTKEEGKALRKWLTSVVDKVNAAYKNGDDLKVGFSISSVLWKTIEGFYFINFLPTPASTSAFRRISSLKVLPLDFEELWQKTLLGNLEERTKSTLKLMNFVLLKIDIASTL